MSKTLNEVKTALSKHANPVPCDLCGELMKNIKGVKLHTTYSGPQNGCQNKNSNFFTISHRTPLRVTKRRKKKSD
ncbi:hypothetical protein BpHYR1_017606 [Brachionus plicatilis]|uniref:C2H2-type domain-containing protein n=1 Tax=Brachionus plicatilis TaxID=10195 RepID=A0A3M7T9Q6_BRAPC|nr:hypothetical protein BpHYR1_017606 [Brachionus plicatilis]